MDDIRDYGIFSDSSVFANSVVEKAINSELLGVPNTRHLDSSNKKISISICWGWAFSIKDKFNKAILEYSKHSLSITELLAN